VVNTATAIDDLADWLTALGRPATLVELAALLVCVGLAWADRLGHPALAAQHRQKLDPVRPRIWSTV
jgi:hypothetical protein